MVLAVDIGNSNIVLGGYEGDEIRFYARIATNRQLEADQYAIELSALLALHRMDKEPIEGAILSSVVPGITQDMLKALSYFSKTPPLLLSLADACGVEVAIDNPRELGMDILASAIAVRHTRPLPAVVIDMGTATKITALDEDGALRGVSIAPGMYLALEALIKGTSTLQGIAMGAPAHAIGTNTPDSMKSGVVLGSAAMLDGMIDRFEQELTGIRTIVATGGAAPVVVPHCRRQIEISDTLLLEGLYHAYRHRC